MTKAIAADDTTGAATIRQIADEAFAALNGGGGHLLPFSTRYPAFSLNDAYRAAATKLRGVGLEGISLRFLLKHHMEVLIDHGR